MRHARSILLDIPPTNRPMKNKPEFHRLLILSKDFEIYKQLIVAAGLPNLTIQAFDDPSQAVQLAKESDLIFGEPSKLSRVINHLPYLQWCQSSWAGVEPLMVPGMRQDYILTNARNVYGAMMSEYVFGYMLLIERRILPRWQSQLKAKWDESPPGTLQGKQIGLLGVGSIGSHLAATAHHFGMGVLGYTRLSETCPDVDRYFHGDAILDFAACLDYLVCSLPGTPVTRAMINANFLSALPREAWLINVGRGNTVDETSLVAALRQGWIAGAVLDVLNEEPLPENHPLWRTPNTFLTSHTAARNYLPDIAALFIENYMLFINRKPLQHQVNFDLQY
jgi:phosphoglycerate dehydrogenase-like enzyme